MWKRFVVLLAVGIIITSADETFWGGKAFEPLRFNYSAVMSDPKALFALYDCFFRQGICLLDGTPTSPDVTSNSHLDLRQRLLGKEWAQWTASSPFWASGVMDRISLEHFEVDTRSMATKGHSVWRSDPLPLHTDGSHLSVGPRMKMYHVAELEGPEGEEGCVEAPVSWFADSRYILTQLSDAERAALSEEPGLQRRCCAGEEEEHITMRPVAGQGWVSWNVHDWVNSTTPTADRVLAAVDAFEAATKHENSLLKIALRPGTGVLIDNFRVMHGRDAMGPMRRLIVGFEAPNAPVEAAWARLRYPTTTTKLENGFQTRVALAAGLRLLHHNGQSDLMAGLFAARHPVDPSLFYAADHSLFWEEAVPDHFQLYSVATGERVQEEGRTMRDVSPNAPVIPIARAVFSNFSHINGIIHAHGPNSMALACAEKNEVLPISEHGFMFHERVGYVRCDFFFAEDYIAELVEALREPSVFVLQMRNHAYLMTGSTVAHTYLRAHMFEKACEVQLKVMASGSSPHVPSKDELEYHRSSYEGYPGCPAYVGELEWPGFIRQLERSDPGWSTRGLPN